MNVTQI